jgi:hypothetical protein
MRSLLLSTDLIRKGNGDWTPTEINTNSGHELDVKYKVTSAEHFIQNYGEFFNHEQLHTFLQTNNMVKIVVIDRKGSLDMMFNSFANYYNYQYEFVEVPDGSLSIPNVDDVEDTLIIRIAYDTYALVDDLYARDMFEFHNLIKDETFASPVTFNTGDEFNIDTITVFEPSIDGVVPNYLVKPRVPGYSKGMYPMVYRLDTQEELDQLKLSLTENQFIQKYEYNEELGLVENRVSFVRSLDLVYGSNLDVINVVTYKSINGVSTKNTTLQYQSELIENKRLNPLFTTKWHPSYTLSNSLKYHFDATDYILTPDLTDKLATEFVVNDEVFGINFNEEIKLFKSAPIETLETFTTGTVNISSLNVNDLDCIFINITAVNGDGVEFSWYDGVGNSYLIQKSGSVDAQYISEVSGFIEIGDNIFIYDKNDNIVKPLTVTNVFYDIKDITTYTMSLQSEFREFLIKLDENIYLLQHNAACNPFCGSSYFCGSETCALCGKNAPTCPNCSGAFGSSYICNSDRRLKENIALVGTSEKGINIYQFNYIGEQGLYEGVIAQELLGTEFETALLTGEDGMYKVDYSKLDVEFKQIN